MLKSISLSLDIRIPLHQSATNQNLEVSRVKAELDLVQTEAKRARAAEEANELTLVAVLARNKELEEARDAAQKRCQEQEQRFEADITEVGGRGEYRHDRPLVEEEGLLEDKVHFRCLLMAALSPSFEKGRDERNGGIDRTSERASTRNGFMGGDPMKMLALGGK